MIVDYYNCDEFDVHDYNDGDDDSYASCCSERDYDFNSHYYRSAVAGTCTYDEIVNRESRHAEENGYIIEL